MRFNARFKDQNNENHVITVEANDILDAIEMIGRIRNGCDFRIIEAYRDTEVCLTDAEMN